MRTLVLGGTGFLGGAIADALVDGGHDVATLTRGRTVRPAARGVEAIRADRHGPLDALAGRRFDWVFDTCAYAPGAVGRLLDALPPPSRYVLASSVSVYGTYRVPDLDEDATVPDATQADLDHAASLPPADRASAAAHGASYGPLKRACERVAADRLGDAATALRAGLLVGAGDYSDRLTWWVRRLDRADASPVPAPAPPDRPVQLIDVRDAAAFAVACARRNVGGVLNVTGRPMPFRDLLAGIAAATGRTPDFRWTPPADFAAAGLRPWTDIPLMAPDDPDFAHFLDVSTDRAEAAGLTTRPLADTLLPLLAWDRARRDAPLTCGMTAEDEARVLAAGRTP